MISLGLRVVNLEAGGRRRHEGETIGSGEVRSSAQSEYLGIETSVSKTHTTQWCTLLVTAGNSSNENTTPIFLK